MKTSDLTGAALDWAVAKCIVGNAMSRLRVRNGRPDLLWDGGEPNGPRLPTEFSTDWSQGGPIIERENIALYPHGDGTYEAEVFLNPKRGAGPTPLIAAMRCFVASKLGDEVDVPEELR